MPFKRLLLLRACHSPEWVAMSCSPHLLFVMLADGRQRKKLLFVKIRKSDALVLVSAPMRLPLLALVASLAACYGPPGAPGDDGKEGPRGAVGPAGPAGPAGEGYRPAYQVTCGTTLDNVSVGAAGLVRAPDGMRETQLHYQLMVYTNADAEVSCLAAIGTAQLGTDSAYYPAVTKGAQSGSCIASADYGSTGGVEAGFWQFDVQTAGPRAVYKDPDNPLGFNGFSYQFPEADCTAHMLGSNGKWSTVMLADVF